MDFRKILPGSPRNESIYVFAHAYYLAFLPWFVLGLVLILLGIGFIIVVLITFPEILLEQLSYNIFVVMSSAYFLLLLPFLTVAFIDFYYDISIVTDRRLIDIDQSALFSREINELALEDVQDVSSVNRGIASSVFDFGDVLIETSGAERRLFTFNKVLHPREIASVILDLAEQATTRAAESHIEPTGATKGVINNEVYHSISPMVQLGAVVVPGEATPTSESSKPVTNEPKTIDTPSSDKKPEPTKDTPPAVATDETNKDLDIVIDDPTRQPPKT